MIRVVDVTQHYGVKPVLKNISLDIPAGSRSVVIGPNGMGKTTLLSVLGGVLEPQHGGVACSWLCMSMFCDAFGRRIAKYVDDDGNGTFDSAGWHAHGFA